MKEAASRDSRLEAGAHSFVVTALRNSKASIKE
jgi:hypothetical protein